MEAARTCFKGFAKNYQGVIQQQLVLFILVRKAKEAPDLIVTLIFLNNIH